MPPVKLTIEGAKSVPGVLTIEISQTEATVLLRDPDGRERTLSGTSAVSIASRVLELAQICAMAVYLHDTGQQATR